MIFAIVAVICMLASLGLFRGSNSFRIDAGPVGSIMVMGSVLFFLVGVLMIGISIGTMMGTVMS